MVLNEKMTPLKEFFSFLTKNLKYLSRGSLLFLGFVFVSVFGISLVIFQIHIEDFYKDIFNSLINGLGAIIFCFSIWIAYKVYVNSKLMRIYPNRNLSYRISKDFHPQKYRNIGRFITVGDKIRTSDLQTINNNLNELINSSRNAFREISEKIFKIEVFLQKLTDTRE